MSPQRRRPSAAVQMRIAGKPPCAAFAHSPAIAVAQHEGSERGWAVGLAQEQVQCAMDGWKPGREIGRDSHVKKPF
jgi:hypothetical protein